MNKIKYISLILLLSVFGVGCKDLEVEDLNDTSDVLTDEAAVKSLASGLFNTWYMAQYDYYNSDTPALAMWTMADAGTCSWGNWGMRDLSSEPREAFDNTSTYGSATINSDFYAQLYSALISCNEVLTKTIAEGWVIEVTEGEDETAEVNAMAYLVQGLSLGTLGLVYDQAYIVTDLTEDASAVELSPYDDLIAASIESLDKCISVCENNTFEVESNWIPLSTTFTQDNIKRLASSYAARFLAMVPRNSTENENVDWEKVYDYASAGITSDFDITMDDTSWWNYYHAYANYSGWGRTDMRIVHMMDPSMPSTWPSNGFDDLPSPVTEETDGVDNRLLSKFEYMDSNDFYSSRGEYHFSCYRYTGCDTYLDTWTEALPEFLVAENDLLQAEALMHLGSLTDAAAIINKGTRVTNGGLSTISNTESEIEDAIFHERMIELFCTAFGLEYFTMRKADLLQEGTMLHFPIPGNQLDVNGLDYYTFGGTTGTAGTDYSNGGWK